MPRHRHPAESLDPDFRACDGGYRAIVQRAPCLIARYDSHLRLCNVNDAVVAASGRARDHWVGRTTAEAGVPGCRHPGAEEPSAEAWVRTLGEAFAAGRDLRVEHEIDTLDGPRTYAVHFLPNRDMDGSVSSVVVIGHDVTAHARAEQALRDREQVLRAALDAAGVGVAAVDRDGLVTEWSPAQERLTGVTGSEALGRPAWELQSALLPAENRGPDNAERVRASYAALLAGGAAGHTGWPVPFMVERGDGTRRLVETTAAVAPDTGHGGALLVTREVEPRPRTDRPGGEHGPA
jgi:PAS domain S-box-containing protein